MTGRVPPRAAGASAAAVLAALWPLAGAAPAAAAGLVCTVSGSAVAFGTVDVLPGAAVQTGGALTVTCLSLPVGTAAISVCVALAARSLQASAGGRLAYEIDGPGTSTPWSATAPLVIPAASLASPVTTSFTAVLAGNQPTAPPDGYGQSLSATVSIGTAGCTAGSTLTLGLTFQVTATVAKACDVATSALTFPTSGMLTTAVDGQSSLGVICTAGTSYTVGLDGGLSGASDPAARRMRSGSDAIAYGLYQNPARSVAWGTAASATVGGTGTAATQTLPIYGRVPVQAAPPPGTYSDTVVVTVTY